MKTPEDWEGFRKQRNLVCKQITDAKSRYVLYVRNSNADGEQRPSMKDAKSSAVHYLEPEDNKAASVIMLHQSLCILSQNITRFMPQRQTSGDTVAASDKDKAELTLNL